MDGWEPRTDLSDALKCIQAQSELAEQTSQQLQDARAEIAQLKARLYDVENALAQCEGWRDRYWEECDQARRWSRVWKRAAKRKRGLALAMLSTSQYWRREEHEVQAKLARLTDDHAQELQDARAENARLEEQYQTTRDLLEYRTGQYAAMSKVAGETEAERDDARGELARLKAPQPCGHPGVCIRVGEPLGDGLYVHYCAWCADVEQYKAAIEAAYGPPWKGPLSGSGE